MKPSRHPTTEVKTFIKVFMVEKSHGCLKNSWEESVRSIA